MICDRRRVESMCFSTLVLKQDRRRPVMRRSHTPRRLRIIRRKRASPCCLVQDRASPASQPLSPNGRDSCQGPSSRGDESPSPRNSRSSCDLPRGQGLMTRPRYKDRAFGGTLWPYQLRYLAMSRLLRGADNAELGRFLGGLLPRANCTSWIVDKNRTGAPAGGHVNASCRTAPVYGPGLFTTNCVWCRAVMPNEYRLPEMASEGRS